MTPLSERLVSHAGVEVAAAALLLAVGPADERPVAESARRVWKGRPRVTRQRLRAVVVFGAIGALLLALPGHAVDPFGVVVPREVVLFAGLILLIESGSYVLMQYLGGSRGLALTGLLAGSANSLAAAGVLARLAGRSRDAMDAASLALLLATFAMIARNVAITLTLAGELAGALWQPVLAMSAVTLVAVVLLARHGQGGDLGLDLDSPLSLTAAGKFAVAYVAILLVSVGAESTLGSFGLLATAFAGGLVSSGAVAVSAATVYQSGALAPETAVGMVILGIAGSLCAKILLVEWVTDDLRRRATLPLVAIGVAGNGVVAVMWLL